MAFNMSQPKPTQTAISTVFQKKQAAIVPLSVGARLGPFELNGGRCSELLARFVINRNGTGTDVI